MPLLRRPDKHKKQSPANHRSIDDGTSPLLPPPHAERQSSLARPVFPHMQNGPIGQIMTASQTTYFTNTTYAFPPPPPANNVHPMSAISQGNYQQLSHQLPWASPINLPGALSQTLYDAGDLVYNFHEQWLGGPPPPVPGVALSLFDTLGQKFNDVITSIDDGTFSGMRHDLNVTYIEPILPGDAGQVTVPAPISRPPVTAIPAKPPTKPKKKTSAANRRAVTRNYFDKVYLYANSRLPSDLPPLKLRPKAYPLLRLAAQYSRRAYEKPSGQERQHHIAADWRMGTKAMVIKSVALDRADTIVFAIRGTQSFRDWATNMRTEPTSPSGFLDDGGNLCHAGFLSVARKMIGPVASRLRDLIKEDPNRATSSLVITGHSAGGAVAALLFCHMYSETVKSELTDLCGLFKRVHCIAFGAPPVTLLPLQKPASSRRYPSIGKAMFLSFINEGDPVTRADLAYVRSLLELYASPAPGSTFHSLIPCIHANVTPTKGKTKGKKDSKNKKGEYTWNVPRGLLSNAGSLVILRLHRNTTNTTVPKTTTNNTTHETESVVRKHPLDKSTVAHKQNRHEHQRQRNGGSGRNRSHTHTRKRKVEACLVTDAQLRGVVFGDPMMHQMDVYADRVERLATEEEISMSSALG